MTDVRREEIGDDIDLLRNVQDELGEWFDAEHEEWVQDKDNPDRESDLSLDLRTDHFRLAGECIEKAIDHLQSTL
nr:MAG TPA: hypothetical protein [Caudoviricetes sp.]